MISKIWRFRNPKTYLGISRNENKNNGKERGKAHRAEQAKGNSRKVPKLLLLGSERGQVLHIH